MVQVKQHERKLKSISVREYDSYNSIRDRLNAIGLEFVDMLDEGIKEKKAYYNIKKKYGKRIANIIWKEEESEISGEKPE
jgi:hypothetical protein